jgi:rhodanese-related sulfurtransferase
MIRNFAKKALRKIAVKTLNMEFDVQERQEQEQNNAQFNPNKIPKVVDGSGDTPGPNHKTNIGRTWLAAQMSGGVHPYIIDIRPPNEIVSNIIPTAINLPGETVLSKLDLLPTDKTLRIVVYDQTGEFGSAEIAATLREKGWSMSRMLVGGIAEWIEFNEEIHPPPTISNSTLQIGDNIILANKKRAFIFSSNLTDIEIWNSTDGFLGPYSDIDT